MYDSLHTGNGAAVRVCLHLCMVAAAVQASVSHANCTEITYKRLRPPSYPPEAAAEQVQGSVLLIVDVEANGSITRVAIGKGAGDARLDTAAIDAVSNWQFNPPVCDGKAAAGRAYVPLSFDLSNPPIPETVRAPLSKPRDAGEIVIAQVGRATAPDRSVMRQRTVAEVLRSLRDDPVVLSTEIVHQVSPTTTITSFLQPMERAMWQVEQSTEKGWNAAAGGWTSAIRTRYVDDADVTWQLYSQVCDGEQGWCSYVLALYLREMKDSPPPIPPPPPRPSAEP